MANELNFRLDPIDDIGLTVTARVRLSGGAQQGSDVSLTESPSGFYSGDFPLTGVPDGQYIVEAVDDTSGKLLSYGILKIRDEVEVLEDINDRITDAEIHAGLDSYTNKDDYKSPNKITKQLEVSLGGVPQGPTDYTQYTT